MNRLQLLLTAAVLGLVFTGIGSGAASPLRVVASLDRSTVLYGDPITAVIEVDYDPGAVDPASIRVDPSFLPYVAASRPVVRRLGPETIAYRYSLLCLTQACLPARGPRLLRLQPVTASGRAGTQTVRASGSWPRLSISSRLTYSDLAGPVRFRSPSSPPAPAYRLAPGPLSGGLIAAAALCTLAALALVGRELAGLSRRSASRQRSRLELAVAYVRDSTRRSGQDRRRALSLLAEAADDREPVLAAAAANTAWSESPPTPARAAELADRATRLPADDG
jgi:hypothetical protein